jgi:HK97 family phage portal protein
MSEKTGLMRFLPSLPSTRESDDTKSAMVHPGSGSGGGLNWLFQDFFGVGTLLPKTKVDYAKEVGDGLGSSVLAGPLNFLMRTFPEAPPIVERRKRAGAWEEEDDHPLIGLLENPNPFYTGEVLWMCTILDFAFGNAYWYKIRNEFGDPIQLWWIPRAMIRPRWKLDGSEFVSHYEYRPGIAAKAYPIDPKDIVHMRFGLDPRNHRLGLSQLGALMREIGIDDEAANFTGAILRNLGIIGVIVSPKEKNGTVGKEALKEVKEYLRRNFTGDKRGEALAVGAPTEAQVLSYNMQGLDISPLRDVSEERVCAALGIPAAVVGFGTGLQQTKVGATMREMRQLAWTGGIIPQQRIIAAEIKRSLLPDFEAGKRQKARFGFDATKVRALWEDQNEKHDRVRKDFQAKLIDRAEGRRETGRLVRDIDKDVFYTGPLPLDSNTNPKTPPPAAEES